MAFDGRHLGVPYHMTPTTDPASPPNFVVKRKRKRYAIDPCLGYYDAPPPDPPPTVIAKPKSSFEIFAFRNSPRSPGSQCHNDTPPIEVLNEALGSSDDTLPDLQSPSNTVGPVTVEAFLQATYVGQKMDLRNRGRRRVQKPSRQGQSASRGDNLPDDNPRPPKRRHRVCPSSPSPDDDSSVDQLFNDELPKQRPAKSKRKAPLAQRLLQAAISSNVNPVDSLVHDADRFVIKNRSLSFIPTKTESSSKRRLWTLKDPHKEALLDLDKSTSFVTQHLSTSERKPLTRWPTHYQDADERRKLSRKKGIRNQIDQAKGIRGNPNICKPLSFVPLREAESSYAARKDAPKKAAKEKDTPNSDTSIKPMSLPLPLVQVPSTTQARSSAGPQSTTHATNTPPSNPLQPAPAKTRDIDPVLHASQVNSRSRSSPLPALQPNASSPFSLLTTARSPSPCVNPEQELDHENLNHLSHVPDINITTTDKKFPKPLSSFLDQFLETAKIAQSQAPPAMSHSPNHAHTKRPSRIRKPTQLPNTPSVEYAPAETNLVEAMFAGDSELPYFGSQSSPNIDLVGGS
uniref:Uncharacterized protein n=1 Tax=Moniliophthora roreri TaxID=221103 RepID=A0A0W0EXM9_MONRR